MSKSVYLICPVRNCDEMTKHKLDTYVAGLESAGYHVHYPPRDVDQTDDGVGMKIVASHCKAMMQCDEVHVFWNSASTGSHFDLGMAYMLRQFKPVKFVKSEDYEITNHKSYGNVLNELTKE